MPANYVSVVLVHGAWADGSSWSKVIGPLKAAGMKVVAAPLPLTSLADDIVALGRALERLDGPVVLAGHAYAGAVIAETRDPKVASLVYIAGLAPKKARPLPTSSTTASRTRRHRKLSLTLHGLVWLPEQAFADAFAPNASPGEQAILAAVQRPPIRGLHQRPG
jgi:pimeloyl-ACP methyl ester carboxylesterase